MMFCNMLGTNCRQYNTLCLTAYNYFPTLHQLRKRDIIGKYDAQKEMI